MRQQPFDAGNAAVKIFLAHFPGGVHLRYLLDLLLQPADGGLAQFHVGCVNPHAHKFNAHAHRADAGLVVQVKEQFIPQECFDSLFPLLELFFRFGQHNYIIHIPYIVMDVQNVLGVLIQLVHVDICEKLAREIAYRHTHVV